MDRYLRRLEAMMLVADKSVGARAHRLWRRAGAGSKGRRRGHGRDRLRRQLRARRGGRALLDTPLDAETIARRAMKIAAEICVYTNHNIVVEKTSESALIARYTPAAKASEDCHDRLLAPRNRFRTRSLYRWPERRKARRRHRAAQSLAAAAARRDDARRGAAQEHPHDRPDRLRQDRNRAPPRPARQCALPEGRGHEIHRSRLCRPRRRADCARSGRGRHLDGQGAPAARTCRRGRSWPPKSASLDALWSAPTPSPATRESFRKKLRAGELEDKEIEVEIASLRSSSMPMFELPNMPGAIVSAFSLGDIFGKACSAASRARLLGQGRACAADRRRKRQTDRSGSDRPRGDPRGREQWHRLHRRDGQDLRARGPRRRRVSREGVQRDLLPLIEGTTVATKHGAVKTDHVLFIASGAFHVAKPSDLLPELQGPPADPRRTCFAQRGRFPPHPDRSRRPASSSNIARCWRTEGVTLELYAPYAVDAMARVGGPGERQRREYWRAAAANGDGAGSRRHEFRRGRAIGSGNHHRRRLCRRAASAIWRAMAI